ncbi:MAG: hypothetical protein ACRDRD_22085, partial [Pseudonocardiaceae bacterium]
ANPSTGRQLVVAFGSRTGPSVVGGAAAQPGGSAWDRIRATSAEFAAAFARYEVGRFTASVRRELLRTAIPDFARQLIARPPSSPASATSPQPAEVGAITRSVGTNSYGGVTVAVELVRRGNAAPLLLSLGQNGARWLVTGLA